jgi:NAD(P)-dependent dehydrogenase (short-subunit alcohol dehydrogenase family)
VKVLVTGASGLIGRHATALLVERGHAVRTFQRTPPPNGEVEHVLGDIESDADKLVGATSPTLAMPRRGSCWRSNARGRRRTTACTTLPPAWGPPSASWPSWCVS